MIPRRFIHLLAMGAAAAGLAVAGGAAAQNPARVDTLPDGSRTFHYDESAGKLTPEEKISMLNAKLLKNPRDGQSWNDLGVLLAGKENFEAARDAFIAAVQCENKNGDYHRNLAQVFSLLDMPEMAVAEFGEYRRFDQFGGQDFWRLIGGAQRKAGQLDEARQTYREGLASLSAEPGAESFRLVLASYQLESEAGDEQAVRDLLGEQTAAAAAFLEKRKGDEEAQAEDGYLEATAIVQNRVALLVEDGKLMEQSSLDPEAVQLYKDAYKLTPERADILPRLVDVYMRMGQTAEAAVAVRQAQSDHPEETGTWIAAGKVHESGGRLEDALASYQKAWEINPLDDLRAAIGNLHLRLGDDRQGGEWLSAGITADTKPEVVYNYAVSLMRSERFQAAIPSLRRVVDERPDMVSGWQALAQCLQATEQYAEAAVAFEQALVLQPDPKTAFMFGRMAQKVKQYDKAIGAYRQAMKLDPKYFNAQYNLALTFMDAGRYDDAVVAFDRLIEIEGPSYRAYYSQGLSYYYADKYDEALEAYDAALEFEKTENVLNNIGLAWDKLGNKKEAVSWYLQAKEFKSGKKK